PTTREIALHASATSRISAFNSPLAPGWRRRSSIRYWVSVVRPASMTASLQASTFVSLGSADSATSSAILPMIQWGPASARRARSVYRSEEHTSELHHEWISYAVFCLKKKKNQNKKNKINKKKRPEKTTKSTQSEKQQNIEDAIKKKQIYIRNKTPEYADTMQ